MNPAIYLVADLHAASFSGVIFSFVVRRAILKS